MWNVLLSDLYVALHCTSSVEYINTNAISPMGVALGPVICAVSLGSHVEQHLGRW